MCNTDETFKKDICKLKTKYNFTALWTSVQLIPMILFQEKKIINNKCYKSSLIKY